MTLSNKILGASGEKIALSYLEKQGYIITHCNWRSKHLEVDIIAKQNETLIFVEVKTRTTGLFGPPENSVNFKKEEKLKEAAKSYIEQNNYQVEIRFDIVSIIKNQSQQKIEHIKDAFW
ncbi:MAG: Uncharacterised protein [Bacteroidetes bacterium MED-G17]|nr:MAG: Uncharacterised protein [Bacteroidetes bacterium MED-G17]|tara:strand:+ start:990 stop:1346 length:357 start_codon:yes stop_codon:yes gene_type:complete